MRNSKDERHALPCQPPKRRAYADDILFRQTAKRYADPWHHVKPAWYYLGVMLPMWMPLNFAWPWAFGAWWRRLRWRRGDSRETRFQCM